MRLFYRILLATGISIAVFLITAYLALFHFGLIERLSNKALEDIIGEQLPVKVHIQEISGNMFSELTVNHLDILYKDSTTQYIMASIPDFTFEYSLEDFWKNQIKFKKVFIDSAEITLMQSTDGRWLLPKPAPREGSGQTVFDFEILELGLNKLKLTLIRPNDTLVFDEIIFKARLAGQGGTYSMDIDGLSYESSDDRLSVKAAGGKITLNKSDLLFQSLFLITDSSDLIMDGHIVFGDSISMQIMLAAQNLNVAELASLLGPNLVGNVSVQGNLDYDHGVLKGDVQIGGDFMNRSFDSLSARFTMKDNYLAFDTLSGIILGGCDVNAAGYMNLGVKPETFGMRGKIDGFNLEHLVSGSFISDLSGSLDLNGQGLKSRDMIIDVDIDLGPSEFDIIAPHAANGHIVITTDSLVFGDNFILTYYDNAFVFSGKIDYDENLYFRGKADFNDLARFNGLTFIETLGGRGEADYVVTGRTTDPDLTAYFVSDSLWLYDVFSDSARLECSVERFMGQRTGRAYVRLYEGRAYQLPFNSAELDMDIDSQFVNIYRFYMDNSFGNAVATANLEYMTEPMHLNIDTIIVTLFDQPIVSVEPVLIDIDSSGYDIMRCVLNPSGGLLDATGRYNYDETLDFDIDVHTAEIATWVKLLTEELDISGIMSGKIAVHGNLDSPIIACDAFIDSLAYKHPVSGKKLNLDLYTAFNYADRQVAMDSLYLKTRGGYFRAGGYFPINLALASVENRFPDAEQSIDIIGRDSTFDLILMYMPEIESMDGQLDVSFRLTGNPLTPNIDGRAAIKNGRIKPYDLILPLEDFNLNLEMENKAININSASATCRDGNRALGRTRAEGKVIIESLEKLDYDVQVILEQFPARYELGDISAVANATLSIRGETPPTVYGDVEILSAHYLENFAEEDEGWLLLTTLGEENNWNLNLNVDFPSNAWVKNDEIDAELAGTLNFLRTNNNYRYIGQLEILRGKGYLADRTFRIEPGGTITYDDIEYPNPKLDIYATTKVRGISEETDQFGQPRTRSYDLCIHITETMDNPEINPCDESQFTREEILALIFTNYYAGANGYGSSESVIGDRLGTFASGFLGLQASQIGTRTLSNIGVETFEIDPVYGDKFEPLGTKVGLGFSVHPNLYVYGRSTISSTEGQEIGFEYRLKRFLLVEGRKDDKELYHLLLNFYWDY